MRLRTSLVAVPALLASEASAGCNADNCLRALRATSRLPAAQAFCATFTATSVAATAIPSFAVDACKDNQNGPLSSRISSACSCLPTTTSAPPAPTEACAKVSSSWAAQVSASPSATPTVAAALAYECLNSVPLHKAEAIQLVEAIEPYMEWQTDPGYKADPPPDYSYPGYDMFAALNKVKTNLQNDVYRNEYAFHTDLYTTVFGPGHDGHFVLYSDILSRVFDWNRRRSLVSISEDGTALPVIKIYEDVIASPSTASVVTHINGIDAAKYVADTIFKASFNQDADAAYNTMFFEKAFVGAGAGNGYFSSGGRIRYIYQGPNTTFTFANGTEAAFENFARIKTSMAGVTDGPSFYSKFGVPAPLAAATSSPPQPAPAPQAGVTVPGYPTPVVITNDQIVSCYFLDGPGFEDVAVIALLAFESESPAEFQSVTQQCFAKAVAAGKKKLVVDFSNNGGGYILQGYDFFRQLFPHVVQDGFSRWKENDGFMAIAHIDSDLVAGVNPRTSSSAELINDYESWFNWRYDLNLTNQKFTSFDDKFAPHVYKDTPYTALMRWDLDDPLTTTNSTFGMGIEITGYGSLANATQPFAPENIIMLLDGMCASTCTLAAEMLRIQGGVKSVMIGGRPVPGPVQGVGGIKGSQTLSYASVYDYVTQALAHAENDVQKAALRRYSPLPIQRSTAAALNTRDQILRGNVQDGLPAQFVREETDCRLFWTLDMVKDVTAVWKAAAASAFNGAKCAAGGIAKREAREGDDDDLQKRFVPTLVAEGRSSFEPRKRAVNEQIEAMWMAKNLQKAVE